MIMVFQTICEWKDCGAPLNEVVFNYSVQFYKKPLCFKHQRESDFIKAAKPCEECGNPVVSKPGVEIGHKPLCQTGIKRMEEVHENRS